jgi:hypothetical protein
LHLAVAAITSRRAFGPTRQGFWSDQDVRPEIDCETTPMRAEVQTIVDEIKQSVGLLRRHL